MCDINNEPSHALLNFITHFFVLKQWQHISDVVVSSLPMIDFSPNIIYISYREVLYLRNLYKLWLLKTNKNALKYND